MKQSIQRDGQLRAASAQALSGDKFHVGALDSACSRTCCGPVWMDSYMAKLAQLAPPHVVDLVFTAEEQERFKFGNGGLVTSSKRFRVPAFGFQLCPLHFWDAYWAEISWTQ